MNPISIFDIYKVGVGPSSSHTLGPWKAANRFVGSIQGLDVTKVEIHLYGSLSKTGKGHATDIATLLGLEGFKPETIDTTKINEYFDQIKSSGQLSVNQQNIPFDFDKDVVFHNERITTHPNTLVLKAFSNDKIALEETYFSIGGGFIERQGDENIEEEKIELPYPVNKAQDLTDHFMAKDSSISDIVFQNELYFKSEKEIKDQIQHIYNTMLECVYNGCTTEGILPGGLNVKRKAKALAKNLLHGATFNNLSEFLEAVKTSPTDFSSINRWVSCFALAVNEENAGLGRIVTSPTNGAAGVIPAVMLYYMLFCKNNGSSDIEKFLLTSGEIGCMFKKGATISAAMGGCQAEIGVSSAMAAGGLTEVLGGSPAQVLVAAEIAMEHHLGLTCDPVGGLVQIPCIERNAMGAMKAITAANLALCGNPEDARVKFDTVVKTMWDTALDMNEKYRETSEGGLAANDPLMLPEC